MRIKKFLRFVMLLIFIVMASLVPVPIKFHKKDKQPSFKIEQIDKKEEEENKDNDYQILS
ncbi:hypothetical protein [Algibacter aquimarinus]|uniref:Secreted protein n=1 Tax=Algibacter aquimarinus TaxID=1136748 RepID=A0ABP9H7T4_9FLAO